MEAYFTFKYYSEMIALGLLFAALAVVILFTIFTVAREAIRARRIHKFFTSHGYERKLLDVSSVGGHAFWGWVRESDRTVVDDRDIKGLSIKVIKQWYV